MKRRDTTIASLLLGIVIGVVLPGCATGPPEIDVSRSAYPLPPETHHQREVQELVVVNRAAVPVRQLDFFGGTREPMNTKTPTRTTVESDIRALLNHVASKRPQSPYVIKATITRADAYGVLGPMYYAPLVGILAAAVPIQLELNVGVLLELERDGSVVSTFPVEERITIERSIASQESYREAYQVLIAEYRRRVLPRIESEFLLKVPDLQP